MTETVPSGIDGIRLLPGNHVCAASCGDHDRDRLLPAEVVINIVETHLQMLLHGILVENPYYVGPDEFLRPTRM